MEIVHPYKVTDLCTYIKWETCTGTSSASVSLTGLPSVAACVALRAVHRLKLPLRHHITLHYQFTRWRRDAVKQIRSIRSTCITRAKTCAHNKPLTGIINVLRTTIILLYPLLQASQLLSRAYITYQAYLPVWWPMCRKKKKKSPTSISVQIKKFPQRAPSAPSAAHLPLPTCQ